MTAGRKSVSMSKDWCSPPELVEAARVALGGVIHLDPCSNEFSSVRALTAYQLPTDGLASDWGFPTIFVNPPYGYDSARGTRILNWFEKISNAAQAGSEIVVLAPVATNTAHWKKFVFPEASAVCFLAAPRLRFYLAGREDPKGAPMACAVIYYGPHTERFSRAFKEHGFVIELSKEHSS